MRVRLPSPALVIAMIALFAALVGSGYAASKFSGKRIKAHSIAGSKLKNDTLTGDQIKESTLKGLTAKAGNVLAATVPVGDSCTVTANTGGISAADAAGTTCDVTFPRSVDNCVVAASPIHPSGDLGGEANARKLGGAKVRVIRLGSGGANPVRGLFSIIAVCAS